MKTRILNLYLIRVLAFIIVLIVMYSCENHSSSMQQEANSSRILPKAYVIGVTEGNIASASSITINFSIDIELLTNGGDIIDEEIFSFKPVIKGKVYWNGNSSLIFQPDLPLKNGKSYDGIVDLGKLFKMSTGQDNNFKFKINVVPMQISIKKDELQPYPGNDSKLSFLDGKIISSDVIDKDKIVGIISAKQDGRKLDVIYPDSDKAEVKNFRVENIKRKNEESMVILSWNGKSVGSSDGGSVEIVVPPLNTFELTNVKVINSPTQYVEISFSDPINDATNLDGIVYLTENKSVKYVIESNKILLYTNTTQTGDAVVAIKKELKNTKGVSLAHDHLKKIHFGQIKPAVRFIDDGVVMPGSVNGFYSFLMILADILHLMK